jgi:hypothetical protein
VRRIVKHTGGIHTTTLRPRPQRAIDARKHAAASKVAAVGKAVKAIGRTGAPVTRVGVAQLAGVSRSFTYENDAANSIIAEAQTRTQARAEGRIEKRTAQEESSWRERALNAEAGIRNLRRELATQRQLVGDLLGQLREPDGTWIEQDRNRLRHENEHILFERNQLLRERNDSNGDWTAHGRTFPVSTNVACRSCSPTARADRSRASSHRGSTRPRMLQKSTVRLAHSDKGFGGCGLPSSRPTISMPVVQYRRLAPSQPRTRVSISEESAVIRACNWS